jgi:hypothetical protein
MMAAILTYFLQAELAGHFTLWLASPEASFLNGRCVWANWDVDEMKARAAEIEEDKFLLKFHLGGMKM